MSKEEKKPRILPRKEGIKIVEAAGKKGIIKEAGSAIGAKASRERASNLPPEMKEFSLETKELLEKIFPEATMTIKFDTEIENLCDLYRNKDKFLDKKKKRLQDIISEIKELKETVKDFEKPHKKIIDSEGTEETIYKLSREGQILEKTKGFLQDNIGQDEKGLQSIANNIRKVLNKINFQ